LAGVKVGEGGLVEAEEGPGDEEAVDGEEEVCGAVDWEDGEDEDEEDVEEWEAWDAQREETPEEGYGVRREELGESGQEGDL